MTLRFATEINYFKMFLYNMHQIQNRAHEEVQNDHQIYIFAKNTLKIKNNKWKIISPKILLLINLRSKIHDNQIEVQSGLVKYYICVPPRQKGPVVGSYMLLLVAYLMYGICIHQICYNEQHVGVDNWTLLPRRYTYFITHFLTIT